MKIEINTDNLTDLDRQILATLSGQIVSEKPTPASAPATATAPVEKPVKAAPVKKAAAPAPAPEPEPEVPTSEAATDGGDEDLLAPADPASPPAAALTMQDAVAAATPLISGGKQAEVKAVLEGLGVKRVSALAEDQIAEFITAINAL